MSDSTFTGNTALSGGGLANDAGTATVTGCTFIANSATDGGGLENARPSGP